MDMATSTTEVERLVRDLNAAWPEGRLEDVGRCFHEGAVMVPPGGAGRVAGREAMVASYRGFLEAAKIHSFEILDFKVDVFDVTACAAVPFQIRYELQGQVYDEKGEEILVLIREAGEWWIAWRTMVSLPSS
jgi:ketosteroid isomerase-like protein